MGKIAKQSLQGSVYNYIGAFLGFLSAGLLMPKFFSQEEVGLVNLLIALTLIFSSFSTLGFNSIFTRLFPYFRDSKNKHNGILTVGLIATAAGVLLTLLIVYIFKESITVGKSGESPLMQKNFYLLPTLILFSAFFSLLDTYNRMLYDALSGILFREVFVRIINLLIIALYIFDAITFGEFVLAYAIAYNSPALFISLVLIKRRQFFLVRPNRRLMRRMRKTMLSVAFFGILTVFSSLAVMNIDKYMINYYLGLSATGIYSVSFYFATVILIPSRAIRKISSVFIADAWKENDKDKLFEIYRKSTINMLLVGVFIFVGIWINTHNIFKILPDYASGIWVILFIGLANLFDMASGVSSGLISASKHYRIHAYIMLFMIAGIIGSNMLLIPSLELTGGALASLLSVFLTVLMRFLYVYYKFGLQPYTFKHLLILFAGILVLAVDYFIPEVANLYLDLLLRSSAATILFALMAYFGKFSEDANLLIDKYLDWGRNIFR